MHIRSSGYLCQFNQARFIDVYVNMRHEAAYILQYDPRLLVFIGILLIQLIPGGIVKSDMK